jgi:hypothetical protein
MYASLFKTHLIKEQWLRKWEVVEDEPQDISACHEMKLGA